MISPIGKIGVRSSGPAGSFVPGWSGGNGSPGRSGSRFTQWVGMSLSWSRNFVIESAMSATVQPPRFSAVEYRGTSKHMTTLRYESYRRVLAVLDELEAPELEGDEREVLRDAAE